MSAPLPVLTDREFEARLRAAAPNASSLLSPGSIAALHQHYQELSRWNPRLSLIGPGAVAELFERHYAESLAALPHLPEGGIVLDVGSGGGFPGLVLAAARPALRVVLTETRERKCAFLLQAARRAALSVSVLDARVDLPLPAALPTQLAAVTSRAVALSPELLSALAARLGVGGVLLLWAGAGISVAADLDLVHEEVLPGSRSRRLLVFRRTVTA